MIASLRGPLLEKSPAHCVIEAGGVGYLVQISTHTAAALPETGHEAALRTRQVVREDALMLFGFADTDELRLFDLLIGVNGVGPRLALAVLSGLRPQALVRAIRDENVAALVAVPGIGRKTAERLVVELRDRLGKGDSGATGLTTSSAGPTNPVEEAVSALIALGYKPPDASRMVRAIDSKDLGVEEIIRRALQAAAK
jgi:Holliday junction DNA helicase RuvA